MSKNVRTQDNTCSACKHEERSCGPNCSLRPYFPIERYKDFSSAMKLYTMSHIQQIMDSVKPSQRRDAAESILASGRAWRADPVHGSHGIVTSLMTEIEAHETELDIVNRCLEFYRSQSKVTLRDDRQ